MRKEYMIFLVLILAAAVVAGSAIGFINNFNTIMHQVKTLNSQADSPGVAETPSDPAKEYDKVPVASPPADTGTDAAPAATDASASSATDSDDQDLKMITSAEKQQIIGMLQSLGLPADQDFPGAVKQFQQEMSLPVTGTLDAQTLHALIDETTRQRARAYLATT